MKPDNARLVLIIVSFVAMWMDIAAFAHLGLIFMLLNVLQCVMIWSLLKLRRVSADEFFQDDVLFFMWLTIGLDVVYVIQIFFYPTFSSAFVLMIRSVQFVSMIPLLPKKHHRRSPYEHWVFLFDTAERGPDHTIFDEIRHVFSVEARVGCEPEKV